MQATRTRDLLLAAAALVTAGLLPLWRWDLAHLPLIENHPASALWWPSTCVLLGLAAFMLVKPEYRQRVGPVIGALTAALFVLGGAVIAMASSTPTTQPTIQLAPTAASASLTQGEG